MPGIPTEHLAERIDATNERFDAIKGPGKN